MLPAETKHFYALTPERVLEAVEAGGTACTGLCYPLNSLENRVYELELEDRRRVVAKFYRPGRWSNDTLLEEHRFLMELRDEEIPVCPPLPFPDGTTLRELPGTGIRYSLFPRVGGRVPDEPSDAQLEQLGRLLARIHNVGASSPAPHRFSLGPETYGDESLRTLEASGFLPRALSDEFLEEGYALVEGIRPLFESLAMHRIHGDCHLGNLLWGSQGPFFLDFDDMVIGPAVQDVWLLVPGREREDIRRRDLLLEGYAQFRPFERQTLSLLEPLRALRYLRYSAWIAQRFSDPAFPQAFPHFGTIQYFDELLLDIKEQRALIASASPGQEAPTPPPADFTLLEVDPSSDDFMRVLALREDVFVEELGWPLERERDGKDRTGRHLLAVNASGVAVGTARLIAENGKPMARVSRIAVSPRFRRHGVGKTLLYALMRLAKELGHRGLEVEAPVESVPFFARLEFVAQGRAFERDGRRYRGLEREWGL